MRSPHFNACKGSIIILVVLEKVSLEWPPQLKGVLMEGLLVLQEMKQQAEYEEFLKEKLMIDEIVRKIYEEDQKFVYTNTPYIVSNPNLCISLCVCL